jgi:hypothetical protein
MNKKLTISNSWMEENMAWNSQEETLKSNIAANVPEIRDFTPIVDTTNENPLITKEKERERLLHQLFY